MRHRFIKARKYFNFSSSLLVTMHEYVGEDTNLDNWTQSAQMINLLQSVDTALEWVKNESLLPQALQTTHCKAPMQLMGEALHALEDTFGHRNKDNEPYSATWQPLGIETHIGIGHGFDLSHPDYTYDHEGGLGAEWNNNYDRTMAMAETVFEQLTGFAGKIESAGTAMSWADIESIVSAFAKTEATEQKTEKMAAKITVLSDGLQSLGYGVTLEWAPDKDGGESGTGYKKTEGANNRDTFLANLNPDDFPGVMLK